MECNTLEECVAFFAKLAEDDPKLEMKELKIDFQRYLNEQARRLRRSANKEIHTELLVGLSLKEWDGSDNLIDEDGQIGTRTVQLLKNIRVGRYLKEYGESLFSREAKEVFSGGYAVFYQIGTITSVSDIQKVLERAKTVTGENYEIVGFQRWLNKEAEKYALEGVNVDGKISDREVELIQQLRLQKTISASKDYDGYATRRWKHYRLDRDEDLYVDDKDIQWDSLERQLKDIDR
ncbi:MAG: hypothetical protein Q8O99_02090 [bacterium]|nr:hypothetical protein [bacterium]